MKVIDFSSNPQCEREHHKKQVREETVIVNPNGTLRNTLVWLKAGVPQRHWETPFQPSPSPRPAAFTNPRLALMTNQDLEFATKILSITMSTWNPPSILAPAKSSSRAANPFTNGICAGGLVPVGCSVHPWMHAYVAVIAHPFFAVTVRWSFDLKGVPPGEYMWKLSMKSTGAKNSMSPCSRTR